MQLNNEIIIQKREVSDINNDLHKHKFTTQKELNRLNDILEANVKSITNFDEPEGEEEITEEDDRAQKEKDNEFAYLLDMPIRSFTNKKIKMLADDVSKAEGEIDVLKRKNEKILWLEDLALLENA